MRKRHAIIKRIFTVMTAVAIVCAPCAEAKDKNVKHHFKVNTGDIVEITSADVRPGNSHTKTEIETMEKEERDSITNGQSGDPDDAGNAWKSVLGLDPGNGAQNINGATAMLTPEQLEELVGAGGKVPDRTGTPATPEEQKYLERTQAIRDAIQGIVDEANSDPSGDSRSPEQRVQDAVDADGDPYDNMDLDHYDEDDIELPPGSLDQIWEEYEDPANQGYIGGVNQQIQADPGSIADISASNVPDSETGQDEFYWRKIDQTNNHLLGGKKTNTFMEYTGICSACYNRAKQDLTEKTNAYLKEHKSAAVPDMDKIIDATAKEYARYSRSKLCHCGKFIRCDSLPDAYQSKYGTDIRLEYKDDGTCDVDSFYTREDDSLFGSKTGESNYSSVYHFDRPIPGGGYSSEIVHDPGNGLYDNFTNEKMVSVDDVSGAGTNRILPGGACYSEKTAKMTLAEVRAAAEKNTGNLPETLQKVGYKDTSWMLLNELSGLDNAENRTIEDLVGEAYGTKGERIYQVQRADGYESREESNEQHSGSSNSGVGGSNLAGGGSHRGGSDDSAEPVEDENGGQNGGADNSGGETDTGGGNGTGTGTGNGQGGTGGTGSGDSGGSTKPGGTQPGSGDSGEGTKPGGTEPGSGSGAPGGDEDKDGEFDAEDVLIRLFGGAAGMDGVRKNAHYQNLLKKFKDEKDLMAFINGLIESGYIQEGKSPNDWLAAINREAEELERSTTERYEVKYYYTTTGTGNVVKRQEVPLITAFKFDLLNSSDVKLIKDRVWGGGSTYWIAESVGKYTVKRYAQILNSVIETREVVETLRVTDAKGNELYNRSMTDYFVDSYGVKDSVQYWTNSNVPDIVIEVKAGDNADSAYATGRVH